MKRKIIAITGARSEYDLLYPVYEQLNLDDRFDFGIIVTGAHLSEKYGNSVQLIRESGLKIVDEIFNLVDSDKRIGRVLSLSNQMQGLAMAFNRLKPDIVLVGGDREEVLSVTTACAYMDIPVAHFFGGDIAKDGNIDNSVRYAAGKLAHIHFPVMDAHKENLIKMGEEPDRIFVIGEPSLDLFKKIPEISKHDISLKLNFNVENDDYFVLIQHSITSEAENQRELIRITLDAIVKSGVKCFINYPNSDAGNHEIIEAYKKYEAKYPEKFKLFRNLDRFTYVNLLRNSKCLLGNSSSGLSEAPTLSLPAINIGKRQRDRICGKNVIFVDNDMDQILMAIKKLEDSDFLLEVSKRENPYGDGNSTEKVIEILANIKIDDKLIYKNITY